MTEAYPRDLIGYGRNPPDPGWPGGARVALQFVLNYEEGAENTVLHGDPGSEQFLSEIANAATFPGRHLSMESLYEYGCEGRRLADPSRIRTARPAADGVRRRDGAAAPSGRCPRRGRTRP